MNLEADAVRRQPAECRVWLPNGREEVVYEPPILEFALRKVKSR
jgi:hypothetical protein